MRTNHPTASIEVTSIKNQEVSYKVQCRSIYPLDGINLIYDESVHPEWHKVFIHDGLKVYNLLVFSFRGPSLVFSARLHSPALLLLQEHIKTMKTEEQTSRTPKTFVSAAPYRLHTLRSVNSVPHLHHP